MKQRGAVYLMYHELEMSGRRLCQQEPGYMRYVVPVAEFRAQMMDLRARGLRGMSVGQALASQADDVVLTFDDGCETDLIAVAPILKENSFDATFYITVGFLEHRGYLSRSQLRDLADLGFEIGSHSLTHPYLDDVSDSDLKRELLESKQILEDITRRAVVHFSCPGGRFDKRTVAATRDAGYLSLSTSEARINTTATNSYALGRVAILRGTSLAQFQRLSRGEGLWKQRVTKSGRSLVKSLVGNSAYDRLRGWLLRVG